MYMPRIGDLSPLALVLLLTLVACGLDEGETPPQAPTQFELDFAQVKQFEFSWAPAMGAQYHRLFESFDGQVPFVQVGDDVVGLATSLTMPLHARANASYMLQACNDFGCIDSQVVAVVGTMVDAIGYFKATNTNAGDRFGQSVALSADGSTLAVGTMGEASNATGIDGNQADNSAPDAGAVYVYVRDEMNAWTQQAYIKASNSDVEDRFGISVTLSDDGNILAVGAHGERSSAVGIDGDQADDSIASAGAVYMFERDGMNVWTQDAYIKASSTTDGFYSGGSFGGSVALSGDGSTLAVGAAGENSNATGIDGDQANYLASHSGAVYVFERGGTSVWMQQAYVKASNTGWNDAFGGSVALSEDGNTLAVGAPGEASNAVGIDGNQADDSASYAGAAYVFERDGMNVWAQEAYVKPSNTDESDTFGVSVALSGDGHTLAVGASSEESNAKGIGGDQTDNSAIWAGAAYVYERDGMHVWAQQAYVKASNTGERDHFGSRVALSRDGNTLAVGAPSEDSIAKGIGGDQADNSGEDSGAAYVYARDEMSVWTQAVYVKAPNAGGEFGESVALSEDGSTLAVGAPTEGSNSTGVGGSQTNEFTPGAGAVYLY
jgi:hypothetical protein